MFLQTFLDYGNIRGCAIYKILPFRHSSEYPTVIVISFFQAQPNFNCQLVSPSDYFNRASVSKFHQSASPSIVSLSPAHPKRKKTNQKKKQTPHHRPTDKTRVWPLPCFLFNTDWKAHWIPIWGQYSSWNISFFRGVTVELAFLGLCLLNKTLLNQASCSSFHTYPFTLNEEIVQALFLFLFLFIFLQCHKYIPVWHLERYFLCYNILIIHLSDSQILLCSPPQSKSRRNKSNTAWMGCYDPTTSGFSASRLLFPSTSKKNKMKVF